jgi:hypothetical protein
MVNDYKLPTGNTFRLMALSAAWCLLKEIQFLSKLNTTFLVWTTVFVGTRLKG